LGRALRFGGKMGAVCIVGMHRSGTSIITGLLQTVGLEIGPEDCLLGGSPSNPKGHFEHTGILEINEALLARLGGDWIEPVVLPRDWRTDERFADLVERAGSLIAVFESAKPWGWKEPRTTLVLPFWQSLVPDLRYVICLRNPLEVAYSLLTRDGIALPRGGALWLAYTRAALAHTKGRPRILTFYGDYFANPRREIRRLASFCGLGMAEENSATLPLLTPELRHYLCGVRELLNHPEVPLEGKLLYYRLRAARLLNGG
jgi:hypothetical protein